LSARQTPAASTAAQEAEPPGSRRSRDAAWRVIHTPEAAAWREGLSRRDARRIDASLSALIEHGPALGRPHVDSVRGSRHHNMKELRSRGGHLRVLFAFDPGRRAVLLVGGDKSRDWRGWYRQSIRVADKLYDNHLRQLGKEPTWTATPRNRPPHSR
jgi:hypothetical protein